MKTCMFISVPCASEVNYLYTYSVNLNMVNPEGPTISGNQQVIPVTKLQTTITKMVKEVLGKLKTRNKGNYVVSPPKVKGRWFKRLTPISLISYAAR